MTTVARPLVSEAEFLELPETSERLELVDGEVIVSPSPSFWHQEVLARIVHALRSWGESRPVTIAQAPLDVRFGSDRILQPDGMVFDVALPSDTATPIDRTPVLCVEVLSSNRAFDRVTKRYLYAEAGVQELWLVEASGLVERRSGPGLAELSEVTDRLETPLLPGFVLELDRIFGAG